MLDRVAAEERLDLAGGAGVDWSTMPAWGAERTIRAAVLRRLLVEPQWPVHPKGVRLRATKISGHLDLESATLRCPLVCEDCFFDSPKPVTLDYATGSHIALLRCSLAGLRGDTLVVTKDLDLTGSLFRAGSVSLQGAEITGRLSLRGADLTCADINGIALMADHLKAGVVALDQGFSAAGAVRLPGAEITGKLSLQGAKLTHAESNGTALMADKLKAGGVLLDQGFSAAGAVRLPGAEITGQLSLQGAKLTHAESNGNAVVADKLKATAAFLDVGFFAAGAVRLRGAQITGRLSLRGAKLTRADSDGNALSADGLKVSGHVALDGGFSAVGTVDLNTTRIDGSLLIGGELCGEPALLAAGMRVGHELRWQPKQPVAGLVDLDRASVHRLVDDWSLPFAHWPPTGQLRLVGFTYDGFGDDNSDTSERRLDWIRHCHTIASPGKPGRFAFQPYEQLARVYRQGGREKDARTIAIARRNDLRIYGDLGPWRKMSSWLFDKTIKHGYQPLRAVVLLAAVYLLVLLAAWGAQHHDAAIVPAKDTKSISPAPTPQHCTKNYPCFYPAGYAVDVVIPLIKTHQADNWRVNGNAPWGWAWIAGTWTATGLGWALSTLAVAGYTGLIRKD
ncbi:hypothetical protein [Streptomyces sp. NPDC051310]|uniref:hypothetical protein n=1 Tax=Streptomyces sp. NPDC051310 TaxID=3365649 RepID=UPI0037BC1532